MKVGYRLVRNGTSTADRAPYLGVAVPIGSLAYDNILQRMLNRGTFMTRATAQYFLNAFYEFAAEKIADDVVRINMGAVSLYPMIGGSFDSEDDEFRVPRNTLYIGATLSQEIRDAVSGISPDNPDEGVWLADPKTGETVATATVERSDSQTIDCVFAEPPEPGVYTLVVACRNGMRESLKPATAKVKNIVVRAE